MLRATTYFLLTFYRHLIKKCYRPWKYEIKCFISCSLFRPFFVGNPQINSGKCIPCMEFCNGNTGLCFPIDLFNSSLNLSSKSRRSGYDDSTQSRWPHYSVADEELERFKGRVSNICMLSKSQGTWKGHKTKFKHFTCEKFRNYFYHLTCILLDYVAHEFTKEFWKK